MKKIPAVRKILAQSKKELLQFSRYKTTVLLAILLPFMTLVIFGSAIRLETKDVPTIVQDFDRTNLSREYIDRFAVSNLFNLINIDGFSDGNSYEASDRIVRKSLDMGSAKVGIIIPPEFSRNIKDGGQSKVQFLIDGTDVVNAQVVKGGIFGVTQFFISFNNLQKPDFKVVPKVRIWFNPGRKESLYRVPGVFTLVLTLYPALLASIAMAREKEEGNIIQVYASGIKAHEFILGKWLAYLIVALAQMIFTVGLGVIIFRLAFVGDMLLYILGTLIFLSTSVLFGLLAGAVSNSQASAIQISGTTMAMATILLSGLIYPTANIPFPLSLVSYIVPARYYIELSRDSFVRGSGWEACWHVPFILLILALLEFLIIWNKTKKMQI